MKEKLPPNFWEEQKRNEEEEENKRCRLLAHLKNRAEEKPNAPFVFVSGKGYFEVPVWVVSEPTEPGVSLGMVVGLRLAEKSFRFLEEEDIITHDEWVDAKWAGTVEEAVSRVKSRS